jgi:hypothetical protein
MIYDQKQLLEYLAEQLEGASGDTIAEIVGKVSEHPVSYLGDGIYEVADGVPV